MLRAASYAPPAAVSGSTGRDAYETLIEMLLYATSMEHNIAGASTFVVMLSRLAATALPPHTLSFVVRQYAPTPRYAACRRLTASEEWRVQQLLMLKWRASAVGHVVMFIRAAAMMKLSREVIAAIRGTLYGSHRYPMVTMMMSR